MNAKSGTDYVFAASLIFLASIFDAFDGKVARWVHSASEFGAELDSICDIVSFGLAPSILIYRYEFVNLSFGGIEWLAVPLAFLPTMGGAIRLARFNVIMRGKLDHKKHFTGMPIPAAANTVGAYVIFTELVWQNSLSHALSPYLVAILAILMVSRIRYDSLPRLSWKQNGVERFKLVILIAAFILFVTLREIAFFPLMILYIVSGLLNSAIDLFKHRQPQTEGSLS